MTAAGSPGCGLKRLGTVRRVVLQLEAKKWGADSGEGISRRDAQTAAGDFVV